MARSESSTRTKSDPALLRIRSILVPIDFSTASKKALQYAVPFARQFGAKLTLLHVVEPVATPDFANSFPLMMENDKVKAASRGQLEHIIKEQQSDGSWTGNIGPIYVTACNLIMLQLDKAYLPIYQR